MLTPSPTAPQAALKAFVDAAYVGPAARGGAAGGAAERAAGLLEDAAGQATQALSRADWYERWGRHYLPSLAQAHALQVRDSAGRALACGPRPCDAAGHALHFLCARLKLMARPAAALPCPPALKANGSPRPPALQQLQGPRRPGAAGGRPPFPPRTE